MSKQTDNPLPYSFREKIYFFSICALFIVFFIPRISQSLGIDETITYWVIKDGLQGLFYRAIHYQGQSPFYFFIVWCFIKILGHTEWALRLPSLLSLIFACFFLYHICIFLFEREWAFFSIICFICLLKLTGTCIAGDARPYGLAIMLLVLSVFCFIKWLKNNRLRYQIAYIVASTATCYAHILYTPIFLIHLCYYLMFKEDNPKVSFKKFVLTLCIIAACILPNVYQLIILFGKRKIYSFALMPGIKDLFIAWFPIQLFILLIAGLFVSNIVSFILQRRINIKIEWIFSKSFLFVLSWLFLPPFILFIVSKIGGFSIFFNRYYFWSYPALAIVIAGFVKILNYSVSKLIAISIFPVVLILSNIFYPSLVFEDWKNATNYINSANVTKEVPILVWPGLIEARKEKWINDHEKQDYLLSPISYYTLSNKSILLPWSPHDLELETLLSKHNVEFFKERDEIWLMVRKCLLIEGQKQKNRFIQEVFEDWLKLQGIRLVEKKRFGAITVSRFIYSVDFLATMN